MKVRFQADADLNHTILLALVRKEPASASPHLFLVAVPDRVLRRCGVALAAM